MKRTIVGFAQVALFALMPLLQGCASSSHWSRKPASSDGNLPKVQVVGGDESSFNPPTDGSYDVIHDTDSYDAVIVGSGLAGLSSATFLTDPHYKKKVLILEKEAHVGGLAAWGELGSVHYDRGAAYWTDTYEEEQKILQYIGLGDFKTKHPIPEPIDSYWVRGKMYRGIWDMETMRELPASFVLFHHELQKANDEGLIPNQPFEEFDKMDLDRESAAQWIRSMPDRIRQRKDATSKKILARFDREIASGRLNANDPMIDVIELMDLYCRSALGNNSDKISAMAFANFYISEIVTRYSTPIGTAQAAENMFNILSHRGELATIKTSTPVIKIVNYPDHAEVQYAENGRVHQVDSKYVVFAAQLKVAPKVIDGFAEKAPEQAKLMSDLGYAHYSVHGVQIKGHPYKEAYDTWLHAQDYTEDDPTDVITGRWVETHGFKKKFAPGDNTDILTIYHPLPQSMLGQYSKEKAAEVAANAVDRLLDLLQPELDPSFTTGSDWKTRGVLSISTNLWPYSVHIAEPGHYISKVKILRKPFERVIFANNNLGTPAFEEALFRGHCGANQVLKRLVAGFHNERWSKCPLE